MHGNRDLLKAQVANSCGVDYVSLQEIKDKPDYEAGMGTVVYGDNMDERTINHAGVAKHPSDKVMTYIAEAVEKTIK